MSNSPLTENDRLPPIETKSDAHGRAALTLVESLIHSLIEQSTLTVAAAVDAVEVAIEVQQLRSSEAGETDLALQKSVNLLEEIWGSLQHDLPAT